MLVTKLLDVPLNFPEPEPQHQLRLIAQFTQRNLSASQPVLIDGRQFDEDPFGLATVELQVTRKFAFDAGGACVDDYSSTSAMNRCRYIFNRLSGGRSEMLARNSRPRRDL